MVDVLNPSGSEKPRVRVPAGRQIRANAFRVSGSGSSYEAAGNGRRLKNFNPSREHINSAIERAGGTIGNRARWLVENNPLIGNAADVRAAWVVGEGIRPQPYMSGENRKAKLKLFRRWSKECDADGLTDYYGIQEKAERELFTVGECFIRRRWRRKTDMRTVPFQLQLLPAEMLDRAYSEELTGGRRIRMGIEFDAIGRRVAYHFWRWHPHDLVSGVANQAERTRVPAEDVIHVYEARHGGQIRGISRLARAIIKAFTLDMYDDAELERKKTAAMFAGFVTKPGEGDTALDDDNPGADDDGAIPLEPGTMVVLNQGEDVRFSAPADVGGSYEPFTYRQLLYLSAATGVPYAYLTADATKGNFSNVRTEIVNFRRKISQHVYNTLIPQLCDPVWRWFCEAAWLAGRPELAGYESDPDEHEDCEHLPPRMEWIDPRVDVDAEIRAIRGGLKTRTQSVAERGFDRESLDEEFQAERDEEKRRRLVFDTNAAYTSGSGVTQVRPAGSGFADPADEIDVDPATNTAPDGGI